MRSKLKISNNIMIGEYAGSNLIRGDYNVFIGDFAGADITEGSNLVIIGDNIRDNIPGNNSDCQFWGSKNQLVIGKTLFGKPLNLQELLQPVIELIQNQSLNSKEEE